MNSPAILTVDDDLLVVQMVEIVLSLNFDQEVVALQNPLEVLDILKQKEISLLVTDFMMPEMNGLALIQQIRKAGFQLPIIILTGYYDDAELMDSLGTLGSVEIIVKPWNNDNLVERIRHYVE